MRTKSEKDKEKVEGVTGRRKLHMIRIFIIIPSLTVEK
jgi:hypothetical protein